MKWTAFICFLCALGVGVQSLVSQAPGVKADNLPSLDGKVVNSQTGEPLHKAYVLLKPLTGNQPVMSQSTDSQGQFKFSGIRPGSYRLEAIHNGFVGPENLPKGNGQPSVLRFDLQSIAGLVIQMVPAVVFTGRVVDEDGEPLAKVRVQCLRFFYHQGKQRLTLVDGTSTDDRGQYRIAGLEPGRYYLTASYNDPWRPAFTAAEDNDASQGYATVYYPGVLDANQATDLVAGAGEERDLGDFRLIPVRLVSVAGRVSHPAGVAALGSVIVSMLPQIGGIFGLNARPQARVGTDGSFRISGVAPGAYTIMAQDGGAMTARQVIDVGPSGLDGVSLTLNAGIRLAGKVRVEGRADAKAASGMRIFLIPQDDVVLPNSGRGVVGADGKFELNNITENDYLLEVDRLPQDFYVKSARMAEQDGTQKPLAIRSDNAGANLELLLSPDGGRVGGTVMDDNHQPVSDATVVLVPDSEKRSMCQLYRVAQTDQNGRFDLRGVPPGEYTALAWNDIEDGAYCDPAMLAPFESKGKSVKVEEKSQNSLDLDVLPKN
jgi:protocatechuate 3,4-dioxygenase beta subunit